MTDPSAIDPSLARPVAGGEPVYVDTPEALRRYTERWRRVDVLGVDTEFVRERTFYPGLGLIQIADSRENVLVDAVALRDLEPLKELFVDPRIVKVLHSCGEDMEVFHHHLGALPWPVFDTQIAAAFLGLGFSLGLAGLLDTLFGIELPKHQTRTNWLKRPLSPEQLEYAALDIDYLLPAYDVLRAGLERLGRASWAAEEFEKLRSTERFEIDPETAYLRVKQSRGLGRRDLGVLQILAEWRETEARRRNLPRNFVLREGALPRLARRKPRNMDQLQQLEALRPDELRRHGRALIGMIRRGVALPEDELPPPIPRRLDLSDHRGKVEDLRGIVQAKAEELGLPTEILATRRTVEALVRHVVGGQEPPLPEELRGWRRRVIGDRLVEAMAAEPSL